MAQVSKEGPGGTEGAAPPSPGPASQGPGGAVPPQPPRHNLPLRTAPVVGRRVEMQAIAESFERARRAGRPGRVEVVGRPGIGATTVAVELARRAGARFPGGAWFFDVAMGADLAWADVAAVRGRVRSSNLAATVREEKERFASGPQTVVVLDGVRNADDLLAAMPLESRTPPFVFAVATERTGATEDVVEVSEVPPQGARQICRAILKGAEGVPVPAVRVLDGQGLTASLSARAAMAWQGRAGPLLIEDARAAVMRLVPLLGQQSATLELLLMASVMHPSRICVDALFTAVGEVRKGRGRDPTPEEISQSVLLLARAGLVQPDDDRRVSIHPIVQEAVRGMAQSERDLEVARTSVAEALAVEAEGAMDGGDGVDLLAAGLHQLRHLEPALSGPPKERVAAARAAVEKSLGIAA